MEKPKKLVFFYNNNQVIGGSLLMFLNFAQYINNNYGKSYKAYYINKPHKYLDAKYADANIYFKDIDNCDYSEFEDAIIFTSINYLYVALDKFRNQPNAKICTIVWHPNNFKYLYDQYGKIKCDKSAILEYLESNGAICYMDMGCQAATEKFCNAKTSPMYVPTFSLYNNEYKQLEIINNEEINIGYLGRLDSDKICTVTNLVENIYNTFNYKKINLHIIGDGNSKSKIAASEYDSRINFIFTSYLFDEDLTNYLIYNVDLLIAMGTAAVNGAELGLPTLIPIVTPTKEPDNRYVFIFDSDGYALDWSAEDLSDFGFKTYTIGDAVKMVYEKNGKAILGKKCYDYQRKNHTIKMSTDLLLNFIDKVELTIGDCLSNQYLRPLWLNFLQYQNIFGGDYLNYLKNKQAELLQKMPKLNNSVNSESKEYSGREIFSFVALFISSLFIFIDELYIWKWLGIALVFLDMLITYGNYVLNMIRICIRKISKLNRIPSMNRGTRQ